MTRFDIDTWTRRMDTLSRACAATERRLREYAGLVNTHTPDARRCCTLARETHCVCELAITCPRHGVTHYGSHE